VFAQAAAPRDPKASLRTAIFLWELMVEKELRHSLP